MTFPKTLELNTLALAFSLSWVTIATIYYKLCHELIIYSFNCTVFDLKFVLNEWGKKKKKKTTKFHVLPKIL